MITAIDSRGLAAFETDWRALDGRAFSLCQTFDYAQAAVAAAGRRGARSFVVAARRGGAVCGLWGLTLHRDGFQSVLRPFSCGTNTEYSWPLLQAPEFADLLFHEIANFAQVADRLMLYNLPAGSRLDAAAARLRLPQTVQAIDSFTIPSARYANWREVEQRLSKSMRYDLRAGAARLARSGALTIGWTATIGETDEVLAFLFARKAEWLVEKGLRSPWIGRPEVPDFFRSLARSGSGPLVAAVRLDGVPIAASVCLVGPRAVEYLVTTFDPRYRTCSPGKLLLGFLARWAIERGLELDLRIVPAAYKERWPVERRAHVTRTVMLTTLGRVPRPGEVIMAARARLGRLRRSVSGAAARRPSAPRVR